MFICKFCCLSAAWCAFDKSLLYEIWFINLFYCVLFFPYSNSNCSYSYMTKPMHLVYEYNISIIQICENSGQGPEVDPQDPPPGGCADADGQPQNDHVVEASNEGGRVVNIHLPWGTGTVYWDAGGRLSGVND